MLSANVRTTGIRFPVQRSPGGKVHRPESDIAAYRRYLRAQVTELITHYGPLSTMWFDVPQEFDRAEGSENVRLCHTLQPDILVNNRAGGGCGNYATPEQRVGGFDVERPWETCMTICRQWSWKPDDTMKSLTECLQTLIRTAGGDGNLSALESPPKKYRPLEPPGGRSHLGLDPGRSGVDSLRPWLCGSWSFG